jgi:hypothetical protein
VATGNGLGADALGLPVACARREAVAPQSPKFATVAMLTAAVAAVLLSPPQSLWPPRARGGGVRPAHKFR